MKDIWRVGTGREARPTLVTIQPAARRSTQPNRLAAIPPSGIFEAMSVALMLTELAGSEGRVAVGDGPGGPSHVVESLGAAWAMGSDRIRPHFFNRDLNGCFGFYIKNSAWITALVSVSCPSKVNLCNPIGA